MVEEMTVMNIHRSRRALQFYALLRQGLWRAGVSCRVCGCTDWDCSGCIARTGYACYWAEPDLCSACVVKP